MIQQGKKSIIVWLVALSLYVLFYVSRNMSNPPLYIGLLTVVLLITYIVSNKGVLKLKFDGYNGYLVLFCLFCYLSSFWAMRPNYCIKIGNIIVEIIFAMTVFHFVFSKQDDIQSLLKLIMWGNYLVIGYAVAKYGWSTIINTVQDSGMRLSNEFLNANTLGMAAAYAVIINVFFIIYEKIRFSDILILPAILVIAASGSRKAILILFGIFAIFILKNYNNRARMMSFFKIIAVLSILLVLFVVISNISIFDNVTERMHQLRLSLIGSNKGDASSQIRLDYNELGLQIFRNNRIIGIGMDNARVLVNSTYGNDHYLHNNYIELLADGGIIGFAIYYSIFISFLITMWKYRKSRDAEWDICIVILIIWLIIDYGCVTYETRDTYVYMLVLWLETKKIRSYI